MEAATTRELSSEKAQRIIEAMRASVARRGAAGSTFDHVAREAGVSRGLLHYYFGTKERLLVEVVRRDCELRMEALDRQLADAHDARGILDALVRSLEEMVEEDRDFVVLVFELFTLARRNAEIATEMSALGARMRGRLAGLLEAKRRDGELSLAAPAEAVATVLFALGDGFAMRMISEPELDAGPALKAATAVGHALISPPA